MKYEQVIKDYKNGIISKNRFVLVMDNDGGYWSCIDESLSDDYREHLEEVMEKKYGSPEGYRDIVEVLNAAGVNCEWC